MHNSRSRSLIYRFALLIIILRGFALRAVSLGERSLWFLMNQWNTGLLDRRFPSIHSASGLTGSSIVFHPATFLDEDGTDGV